MGLLLFKGTAMKYRALLSVLVLNLALFILPGAAAADSAVTTGNVNLRGGPGAGYARVATLPSGLRVEVLACQSNWCRVARAGMRGWVSANYLEWTGAQRPAIVGPPAIVVRPPYYGARPPYYHVRPPHYRPRPPRPDRPRPPRPDRPTCRIAPGYPCR